MVGSGGDSWGRGARMVSQEPESWPCPSVSTLVVVGRALSEDVSSGRNGDEDIFPTLQVALKLCLEPEHLGLDLTYYLTC